MEYEENQTRRDRYWGQTAELNGLQAAFPVLRPQANEVLEKT